MVDYDFEIFETLLEKGELRNSEIRDEVWSRLKGPKPSKTVLNVVISNRLSKLAKEDVLTKNSLGHKNVRYSFKDEKARKKALRMQDAKFAENNQFYASYDLEPYQPQWKRSSPQEAMSENFPTFPFPTRAILKMNENARLSVEPWILKMRQKHGYSVDDKGEMLPMDEEDKERWFREATHFFADPMIRKLVEVLVERARVVCGHKQSTPGNIFDFNFEFTLRYDGEKTLRESSEQELKKAENLLAGILLLYIATGEGGPIMRFIWHKEQIKGLVKGGVLTKKEVLPLLRACKEVRDSVKSLGVWLDENELSKEDLTQLHDSAYKRFNLAYPRE